MTILRLLRYIIHIFHISSGRILLPWKQMLLCSSLFIIRVLLYVLTTLENVIDRGTRNVITSKMPLEKKHWYKNVKFSSPKGLNIQEDVKLKWFTKLEESYANPNLSNSILCNSKHSTWV